jgi:hypothetical protein
MTPSQLPGRRCAAKLTDAEKQELQQKLTDPMIDFYAQTGQTPVASIMVTVPTKKGAAFNVVAIQTTGGLYQSFTYSKLGSPYDVWVPNCGPGVKCQFSEEYKNKYPDVVAKANG